MIELVETPAGATAKTAAPHPAPIAANEGHPSHSTSACRPSALLEYPPFSAIGNHWLALQFIAKQKTLITTTKPMKLSILTSLAFAISFTWPSAAQEDKHDAYPNIIFVMADDMGYGDLKSYNPESKIETPHLARLAKEGRRFTDAHAPAGVCVPTRLWINDRPLSVSHEAWPWPVARAQSPHPAFRPETGRLQNGDDRQGHSGVEHEKNPAANQKLGGGPVDHGFDHFFGIPASLDIPPYYWIHNDRPVAPPRRVTSDNNTPGWTRIQGAFWRGGGIAPGYKHIDVLPIIRDRSADYIEAAAKSDIPFFLWAAPARAAHAVAADQAVRGQNIGQRLRRLRTDGRRPRRPTVLWRRQTASMARCHQRYAHLVFAECGKVQAQQRRLAARHEGRRMGGRPSNAIHRPLALGHIPAGRKPKEVICHTDMIATAAAITGQTLPTNAGEDSYNLLPAFLGKKTKPIREATVHQSSRRYLAIRQGNWKLIPGLGSGGFSKPSTVKPKKGEPAGQLYNLKNDLGKNPTLCQAAENRQTPDRPAGKIQKRKPQHPKINR